MREFLLDDSLHINLGQNHHACLLGCHSDSCSVPLEQYIVFPYITVSRVSSNHHELSSDIHNHTFLLGERERFSLVLDLLPVLVDRLHIPHNVLPDFSFQDEEYCVTTNPT